MFKGGGSSGLVNKGSFFSASMVRKICKPTLRKGRDVKFHPSSCQKVSYVESPICH